MAAIINEEESLISPTYAIYLSSCNIDCLYCHQKQLMKPETKSYIATEYIINDVLINLSRIKTISFVGGNPELSFLTILRIIKLLVKANIDLPLVFNSTFLFAEKLYSLVDQYFNILIPDFKFWDGKCSKNLCGISSYRDIVQNNISYFLNKKEIIIRHLPLPGHWDCCSKPIIDWIASKVGEKDLCSLAVLDLLQADNSKSVNKCKSYAKKLKLKLN
jgi:putative pyruvate formate lyase activating enzyme